MLMGCFFTFFVFGAAGAGDPAQVQKDAFDFFDKSFFQSVEPTILTEFSRQVESGLTGSNIDGLLQQLPFEPDNLNTGDCTFHACCIVLLLQDLRQNQNFTDSVQAKKVNLLARIAVLTYVMHSEEFFTKVFTKILTDHLQGRTQSYQNSGRDIQLKLQQEIQDLYQCQQSSAPLDYSWVKIAADKMKQLIKDGQNAETEIKTIQTVLISLSKELLDTWAKEKDNANFLKYKCAVAKEMAAYVTAVGFDVKIDTKPPQGVKKRGEGDLYVVYPSDETNCKAKLVEKVKSVTGRFIRMEREFSGLDSGGELGCIKIAKQLRSLPNVRMDMYDEYEVDYQRSAGHTSSILQKVRMPPASPSNCEPTLVLQITQQFNPSERDYLDPTMKARPIEHEVQKLPNFLIKERADCHAITSSAAGVLARNVWWSGQRGLSVPSDTICSYIIDGKPCQLTF